MKLTTLISQANEILEKHGDLLVVVEIDQLKFVTSTVADGLCVRGEYVFVSNRTEVDK